MNNEFVFLRHALTEVDLSKPADQWVLSNKGIEDIKIIAEHEYFDDIDLIYTSTEQKAIQTASFISERLGKEISTLDGLKELVRKKSSGTIERYEQLVKQTLERESVIPSEWETADNALMRFKKAIGDIDSLLDNKKILVVSHGLVLSLYFADLLKIPRNQLFERWRKLGFCSWGVVENNKVIKDII